MFIKVTFIHEDGTVEAALLNLDTVQAFKLIKKDGNSVVEIDYKDRDPEDSVNWCNYIQEDMKTIAERLHRLQLYVFEPKLN